MNNGKKKSAWEKIMDKASVRTSGSVNTTDGVRTNENDFAPGAVKKENSEESVPGTEVNLTPEGDITKEDMEALGPKDLSMDGGDDEQLKHRTHPVNFSGDDLDVPGAELDDDDEERGSEDEENNSYSLGADKD